jgi:WS/DGAT/MGAT family acyltransferase
MTVDRLTALDASFLWLERPGVPIHVGAVATFEAPPLLDDGGNLRLDELRARIDARIGELPRLRRRLAAVPFDLDRPHWVDDPGFDIARHVGEVRVPPPGDDAALRLLAGRLLSEVLPRDRPLWDLRFVTGLAGGRVGLIERVHHALVDGVSGVDLATVLLDLEPDTPAPPQRGPWSPPPLPAPTTCIADALRDRAGDPARAVRRIVHAASHPAEVARALRTMGSGLGALLGDGVVAPHTALNRVPEGGRQLAWVRAPLDDVRATGAANGATVNDVVLNAVAGGLRCLFLERGERVPTDLVLKVLVPVSLRRDDERDALGNRVGAIYAPLPVGLGDPEARLGAIAAAMRRLKARDEGAATGLVLDAANVLPVSVSRLLARAVEHQRVVNLVVTNVPGPPVPLYAAGARMLDAFPVVPLGANLSVGAAVLSYAGTLSITVTADSVACPDVDAFATGIEQSFVHSGIGPTGRTVRPRVAGNASTGSTAASG